GSVYIGGKDLKSLSPKETARRVALVLTDRVAPRLISCFELVSMGRYPYTGMLGRLNAEDRRIAYEALERVGASELSDKDFSTLSDGQKQRVLLARAICQEPELLILDEPTAYLDIRYKIELLEILRTMAKDKNTAILMSLHEIDLASKVSDLLMKVREDGVSKPQSPGKIMTEGAAEELFGIERGSYDPLFGSVELPKAEGKARVFVVSGAGSGIPLFRELQRRALPFSCGVLREGSADLAVAERLAVSAVSLGYSYGQDDLAERPDGPDAGIEPSSLENEAFSRALAELKSCETVICTGLPEDPVLKRLSEKLLKAAEEEGLAIAACVDEIPDLRNKTWRKLRSPEYS
ncbi:MAG: ABC transporter ATP-binding protein, partial [Firmicutes bacterium]|nr:ABC transporter ATP-binding protein [Bacillota bacterium]